METTLSRISFHQFTDEQLIDSLWTAEDRLTREMVDEFVGRGERMIWRLTDLCRDERSWTEPGAAFWAPVHATFILGAFGDSRALMGLLASLRWSAKYDIDWVYEKLPSILGRIGRPAILPLKARVTDRDNAELDRMTELHALAGIAARHPIHQGEVLDFVRSIADDADEDEWIRSVAASVLLKFVRPGDRKAIVASSIRQEWCDRPSLFDGRDIEAAYARGAQQLEEYLQDGLDFYASWAIEARQRRWDEESEDARWAAGVEVWHRDRLDEAQRRLRERPGVSVLIYDQRCAAEKRRLRKRGKLADPALRVVINEAVCEGCGDCGVKSNCLSVQPVETEFGRKTQIHQSSCNKDYSCLLGDCPSFLTVVPASEPGRKPRRGYRVERALPDPVLRVPRDASLYLTGIGGTGVVTVNQLLGTAALLDGKSVSGLDQTGLSQKGGPVVSHLKILERAGDVANKVGAGEADAYLGFDLLVATVPGNLACARPDRTIAIVSTTQVPTGAMVASPDLAFPDPSDLLASINRVTRKDENVFVDAIGLAEALFADHMAANMIVLGAAYQAGAIPLTAAALEQAIALNGVGVEMNTEAFRVGRLLVADPQWVTTVRRQRAGAVESVSSVTPEARRLVESVGATGELRRLLEVRIPELIAYQDARYAAEYAAFVRRVADAERAAAAGETRLAEAVARFLFKLMAYKDEYEVARLHLKPEMQASLAAEFGASARVHYQLHPPILRALGWTRKIALGRWFEAAFRLLVACRRLRGTPLDPFGHAEVRRVERALVGEYRAMVERALAGLSPATYDRAVGLARLPDLIRGYEGIKLRNVERFRTEARRLAVDP